MVSPEPALAVPPNALIADELTLGLAPLAADAVMEATLELRVTAAVRASSSRNTPGTLQRGRHLALMELGNIVWTGPRRSRRATPHQRLPRRPLSHSSTGYAVIAAWSAVVASNMRDKAQRGSALRRGPDWRTRRRSPRG
jgi:hypothetical protein